MNESLSLLTAQATDQDPAQNTRERSPALSILVCFSAGILLDAWFQLSLVFWISISIAVSVAWVISFRAYWNSCSTIALLILTACLGGMRHHEFWFCHTPHHISRLLINSSQEEEHAPLIRVIGVICHKPQIKTPADEEQINPSQPT
ncbi:MAG: hypothetical protein KDA77_23740, partial [Planctomycetaceae bacterium]|nr:hypothetical protein [Planctomycetaceae bacterium]